MIHWSWFIWYLFVSSPPLISLYCSYCFPWQPHVATWPHDLPKWALQRVCSAATANRPQSGQCLGTSQQKRWQQLPRWRICTRADFSLGLTPRLSAVAVKRHVRFIAVKVGSNHLRQASCSATWAAWLISFDRNCSKFGCSLGTTVPAESATRWKTTSAVETEPLWHNSPPNWSSCIEFQESLCDFLIGDIFDLYQSA